VSAADGEILGQIASQAVVPVLRNADPADAAATARACAAAGMGVVELTHSTPELESALRELRDDPDLIFGVGTVTEPEQVRASVELGARFIVSFGFDPRVVETALELGVDVIPGALTPTEVALCRAAGASAVKLFPARLIRPAYLADLRAVMPGVELVVTGGIAATPEAIRPWLDAGALAIGVGSALGTAGVDGREEVERRCRAVLEARYGREPEWPTSS
jgi:2-dehydro-3-deoxyphosphogluconate aldolase/(4S)-4-hydroxy-2-oxoglutarate aldolase